jgi:hypothetical protein
MSRKQQAFEPDSVEQAQSVYRASFMYLPKVVLEAWNEEDAANKYRDKFDLCPSREIVVEKVTNGSR